MKIQTFKTNGVTYTEPSIMWNVKKEDLMKIQYFQNMFEFSCDDDNEILMLKNVNDTEFKLIIDYINLTKNEICINEYIENLTNDELLYFIKISDFFLIDDLLEIVNKDFFRRLEKGGFN